MESADVATSQNKNNRTDKTFSKETVKMIKRMLNSKIGLAIGSVCLLIMFVFGLVIFQSINKPGLKRDIFGNKYEYIANIDNKSYKVAFGEKAQGTSAVLVSENGNEIKMTRLDSEWNAIKSIPQKLDDKTLLFKDVSDTYDVKYKVTEKGIKE